MVGHIGTAQRWFGVPRQGQQTYDVLENPEMRLRIVVAESFPRNSLQAEFFLESYGIDAVLLIDVPNAVVQERILNRRLCSKCGLDYNLIFHRLAVANACDICGGTLISRSDDTPEAVRARLQDYHTKTQPILDLFRRKEPVVTVDGTCSANEVHLGINSQRRNKALPPCHNRSLPSDRLTESGPLQLLLRRQRCHPVFHIR